MNIYYDKDADLALIQSKKVAVVGYGSQGHAHVLNMRESGVTELRVALKEGSASREKAEAEGLKVVSVAEATAWADVLMILAPDEVQAVLYAAEIEPHLSDGMHLMFGHGFNIHYNLIRPPAGVDVSLSAPKGPGHTLRNQYQQGRGLPGLVAIHQDATGSAKDVALSYSKAIGNTRAGVIETSVQGRDRDRSLWRAGGALRRRCRADQGRVRYIGRGGLRAGNGLFRMLARGQTHRRPDL